MTAAEEEFLRTLRATFKVEAAEHLGSIGSGLLALEKVTRPEEQLPLIETVFRAAHSLKGAARAVNFTDIESLCQSLESLFASWKRRESFPTPPALDAAHRDLNRISEVMTPPAAAQRATPSRKSVESPAPPATPPPVSRHVPPTYTGEMETVRIAVGSLDTQLLEAEEMVAVKLGALERATELGALVGRFEAWRKEWSRIQPRARTLRRVSETSREPMPELRELANFLDWNHGYLRSLEDNVTALRRTAEQERLLVGKLVDDLLENSKKLLMLPMSTLSALLAKVVRDLCHDQGKEAELATRGGEITIDKRILDELKDPLIHMLRNCVDHGIETPDARSRMGKPRRATITLAVTPIDGNQVEISVSDDGAGIDIERVKQAAAKRGLLVSDQIADAEALALVFETDVSTSPMITQVSGRGLGLAIVREKTEQLGGRVTIDSHRNTGTRIGMTVPLTLSTFRGVLIKVGRRSFIAPTAQVERVLRFKPQDVQTVESRATLALNGRAVSLVDLAEVLQLPPASPEATPTHATPAIVLSAGEQRVAFLVTAVIDEREVLVKQLVKPLVRVRNIAGATILGSGEVVPILNVHDLLKSARSATGIPRAPAPAQSPTAPRKRILVVEDSVTSRMLLRGILESAGYQVKTAVDGMEAFTALRLERFDLVVSDVEMPRMDGFNLTARIRAERALADTPVVLVTALESREDRERGIDVGANAYLVKSNLDQGNLLEALRRLL
jgi:two-component system, chemotaxis family, sensor kinase CheA